MAVARAQSGPVLTGVHIALIVFVVVTVASLVGLVLLYTHQEDLTQRAEGSDAGAKRAQEQASAEKQQFADLATLLVGDAQAEFAVIEKQLDTLRQQLLKTEGLPDRDTLAQASVLDALRQLATQYANKQAEMETTRAEYEACTAKRDELAKFVGEQEARFNEKTSELQTAYETLAAEASANRQEWQEKVDEFEQNLAKLKEEQAQALSRAQSDIEQKETKVADLEQKTDKLESDLAKFKPSHDPTSILRDADGEVLHVLADGSVAYINLGKNDRVTPGLTFAVYSPLGGIGSDGQGKATLEVTHVMRDTSECRVTMTTPGAAGVVVKGDLIANPVYDRNRTFTFVIAGDFDLDFDGKVDDPDAVKVKKLVMGWGGQVTDTINEQTDFVVLGLEPNGKDTAIEGEDPEATRIRIEERQKKVEAFRSYKEKAAALNIPVLTRTQFLHFIGYRPGTGPELTGAL